MYGNFIGPPDTHIITLLLRHSAYNASDCGGHNALTIHEAAWLPSSTKVVFKHFDRFVSAVYHIKSV